MNQSQDPNASAASDARNTMNWAVTVVQIYAMSVEVFLHRSMGERYLGPQVIGVPFLVFLHAYLFRDHDPSLLMLFLVAFVAACLLQRIGILWRGWTGRRLHSRYNGSPWLLARDPRADEVAFKIWIEPVLVIAGGLLVVTVDPVFGWYIVTAGVALHLQGRLLNQLTHSRVLDARDAMFEQQIHAEQFRRGSGDRRDANRIENSRPPRP